MPFLKAKPWVIFSLLILVPVVGIIVVVLIAKASDIRGLIPLVGAIIWLPVLVTYFGWLWSAGSNLIRNPQSKRLFKTIFLSSLICAFLLVPAIKVIANDSMRVVLDIISLLNFLGLLYCINLIRKGLNEWEAELGLFASSKVADFITIWILPIGIWFLQPRIQLVLRTLGSSTIRYGVSN